VSGESSRFAFTTKECFLTMRINDDDVHIPAEGEESLQDVTGDCPPASGLAFNV
jgi:hypothetical protein